MTTIPSLPWPHDDLERQHLLHGLTRLSFAEVIRVDGELRYRLLPHQPASTPVDGRLEFNVDRVGGMNA
jgi:hypothetical protein